MVDARTVFDAEEMQLAGTKPNGVTFLSVLSACCHAGLVEGGVEYFESMRRDHGITPTVEHYAIIVDLLGRAGHFAEIVDLFRIMPMELDLAMWSSLLGACQKHGNVGLGELAFDHAVCLQRDDAAAYVLMWNIYTEAGLWQRADQVQELRQKAGAWKKPGQSWINIEHEQEVHTFVVGDCRLSGWEPICQLFFQVLKLSDGQNTAFHIRRHHGFCRHSEEMEHSHQCVREVRKLDGSSGCF